MKNLLNKGKVIVSCISVLAILAVSLLSMFTGVTFIASAEGEATEGETTVTYPLNGSYDADVKILEGGISYEDVSENGTVTSFTEFDTDFWLTAEGNGTAANPYIVETANQFAAIATANLTDAAGNLIDTTGMSFKVADGVKAFNMNNTESTVDFSGNMTADEVESALADAEVKEGLAWFAKAEFKGRFDGNGVVVYGLKSNSKHYNSSIPYGGLFQVVNGVTIRNLTVKNCYFTGDSAGGLVGYNQGINPITVENCSIYNNVGVVTRLNEGLGYGGVVVGRVAYIGSATAKATISNCLIYGNDFKHSKTVDKHSNEYDINYGLVANFNTINTYTLKDSIVLDSPCYSISHSHNAFHRSNYSNVYTNMVDVEFTLTDYTNTGATKIENVTTFKMNEDGSAIQTYNKLTNGASNEVNYSITHDAGKFIKADPAVKGSAAKDLYTTLDSAIWSFDGDGYPTPRIYKVREYSAGEAWSGEVALFYSGGSGTKDAPYQIATAEELALMMTTVQPGECFALTADIIINDTSAANWTDTAKKWFTSNDTPTLTGTFNGNGHTVSGIYYDGTQAGEYAGLIPMLGSNAAVKNVTIANSVLNGKNGAVGAVVGATEDMCAQVIKTSAVIVEDTVKFDGNATKGGIIGKIGYSAVKIEDCLSKSAGLYGEVTGQANIKRSVSVGAYPFTSDANVKAENVYTDTEGLTAPGVTVVANADMLGAAAETAMAGLGFPTSWKTVDGSYPAPTGAEASADGVAGDVWSGAVASNYAGGNGTKDSPYLIATGEQLARFVTNVKAGTPNNLTYYKLTADIYLNDVDGNLWKDKVGCTEWYTQRTNGKGGGSFKYISFDGDGHVVYGMYINQTQDNDYYYRAGLMPYLNIGSEIKNVGISEAYLKGDPNNTSENIGGLVGVISNWHTDYANSELLKEAIDAGIVDESKEWIGKNDSGFYTVLADPHDAAYARTIQWDADYNAIQPDITNCFVDHTCYISGYTIGGLVGTTGASVNIQNCAVTASIEGADQVGGLIGSDWGYLSTYAHCVSFPQTCNKPAMGSTNSDWRGTSDRWVAQVYKVYYFSIKPMFNDYFIKISNPLDRVGTAARNIMTGLDWDDNTEDGTKDLWRMVDGGTPVLTVFAKHRSDEDLEKFSDKKFAPPYVTVNLSTGTDEIQLDPLEGRMYSKITLPTIERDGYEFTGWYAFSDLSVKYPLDYFPPRSLTLYAGWEPKGIIQNFENYTETIWDNDSNCWVVNKPGAKGGYKNAFVRNGSKSMHLLGTNTEPADCLLNYEEMLKPGTAYTITFWVTTDTENNPATLLSLVHNSKPDYLNSAVAVENMAVATGLKVGKWEQYSYSFTAQTKWVSIRATAGSSLYFDDMMIAELDGTLEGGKVVNLGTGNGATGGVLSPNTSDAVSVAVLISAVMACAVIAVISRKNLIEIVEE